MQPLPVFAIDIDDVLMPYQDPMFTAHVERITGRAYPYEAHTSMYLSDALPGINKQQELEIVHAVYADPLFWEQEPVPGAIAALTELSRHVRCPAITARPQAIDAPTREWFERKMPGLISDIVHIGLQSTAENIQTKLEVATGMDAIAMADDTRHHLDGCSEANIRGILFDHPWNRNEPNHPDFIRVKSWDEVPEIIYQLLQQAA